MVARWVGEMGDESGKAAAATTIGPIEREKAHLDVRPRGLVLELQRRGGAEDGVGAYRALRQGAGRGHPEGVLEAADCVPVRVVGREEEYEVRPQEAGEAAVRGLYSRECDSERYVSSRWAGGWSRR